jgi:hypothetical protein
MIRLTPPSATAVPPPLVPRTAGRIRPTLEVSTSATPLALPVMSKSPSPSRSKS